MTRELKAINRKLNTIMAALGLHDDGTPSVWLNQGEFSKRTGFNTRQLEHFRQNNPELIKFKYYGDTKTGKPIRRDFKYDWAAYQRLFTNPFLKS